MRVRGSETGRYWPRLRARGMHGSAARPSFTGRVMLERHFVREWAERRWLSARSLWVLCLDGRLEGSGALDGALDRDALALLGGIEDGVHDLEDVQAEVEIGRAHV